MKLTSFSDYSFRVLIFLGIKKDRASIEEISKAYNFSKNHLVKVVHNLVKLGYVRSIQGKGGGIELALNPEEVNLGKIIQQTEPDFDLVECFNTEKNTCCISPSCKLKKYLLNAKMAFLASLSKHSLADIIINKKSLRNLILN